MVTALKRAVEVETDAITSHARVLIGQREDEGSVVPQADAVLPDAQAALGLAEKHHVRWKGKVGMVFQGVASQELWRLSHTVATGLPESGQQKKKIRRPGWRLVTKVYKYSNK